MTDLNYLNGRLRAMRGRFLDAAAYEAMLGLPDLESLAAALQETPYGPSLDGVPEDRGPVERMEEGLRRNFSETLFHLSEISRGGPDKLVEVLMGYWDLCNLKTIIRGLVAGLPAGGIMENLIPTPSYDEPALAEVCGEADLSSVSNLLLTWRDPNGWALKRGLGAVREARDLVPIETELDRSYFERAFRQIHTNGNGRKNGGILGIFLSAQVDRINLLTALKAVEDKAALPDDDPYFLKGGTRTGREVYSRVRQAPGLSEAFSAIGDIFPEALPGEMGNLLPGISVLTRVERALDIWLLRKIRRQVRVDPLGRGLLVLTLIEKIKELGNIRMILRGRRGFLPDPEIFRLLILEV